MVRLWIIQRVYKLLFILVQIVFIYIPCWSQDNIFSLHNLPSDSSHIFINNTVVNASQKQRLFKCYPGLEFGYSRLKRNYHIDPAQSVQLATPLIKGDEVYIGFTGEAVYKTRFSLSTGIFGQYQRFHYKIPVLAINGYRIYRENFLYGTVPITFSITMPFKRLELKSELGFSQSFLLHSEYIHIDRSPYGRITYRLENILNNKYYSSIFFGAKFRLKNNNIFIHIKYVVGLTRIMLPADNGYTSPFMPPPNYYYRKNGISLSIQYRFK